MVSMVERSPYLSPPEEFLAYPEVVSSATINPQVLTSTDDVNESYRIPSNSFPTLSSSEVIKVEHDDDYGFSKFAAERDAARDEMDLDEDTKLLMSEEGKKLSSKERRQLRNKVSARNFRERRKEYITHLESLVSRHQNEAATYKAQVDVLKSEKDDLASELSRLKISLSAAFESSKLQNGQTSNHTANIPSTLPATLTRTLSRSSTPTKEMSLIPSMTKDINPYSANASFIGDWPLSSLGSPSSGSFDFNLHNYTSVFSLPLEMPTPGFSEKELIGKTSSSDVTDGCDASERIDSFDRVLSSILGNNWAALVDGNYAERPSVGA